MKSINRKANFKYALEPERIEAGISLLRELNDPECWWKFGFKFASDENIEPAERIYKEAIERYPHYDDGHVYHSLCSLYERAERYEDAIEICMLATELGFSEKANGVFQRRIDRIKQKREGT